MKPVDLAAELAAALRDVIQETPEESLDQDPKNVYMTLACRLIVRLAPKASIVPKEHLKLEVRGDEYVQVRTISDEIMRSLAAYRLGGFPHAVLGLALIDAYVRVARAGKPGVSSSALLLGLAAEAEEMAGLESASTNEWGKH